MRRRTEGTPCGGKARIMSPGSASRSVREPSRTKAHGCAVPAADIAALHEGRRSGTGSTRPNFASVTADRHGCNTASPYKSAAHRGCEMNGRLLCSLLNNHAKHRAWRLYCRRCVDFVVDKHGDASCGSRFRETAKCEARSRKANE